MIVKLRSKSFFMNYTASKGVKPDVGGDYRVEDSYITVKMLKYMGGEYEMHEGDGHVYKYVMSDGIQYGWPEWMIENVKEN